MTSNPAEPHAAAACALLAALAVARGARWSPAPIGPVLPRPFSDYLCAESAQLLLVPSAAPLERVMAVVATAMRRTRSDALIVSSSGRPEAGVRLALGIWRLSENQWHAPMSLWKAKAGPLWLVPNPYHAGVRRDCFLLQNSRLRPVEAPWRDGTEHRSGRVRASAWLERAMGERWLGESEQRG
ncbi:hypothetical protein [uncultured Sphingomonas sp.]|uniref:hypothetical protein n=1 Tax=uncultured Sphingomonas sp. TaxID=158754 RepID=UPI0035CA4733